MISSSKLRPSLETAFQLLPPAAGRCNYQEERQRQRALDRAGRLGIASSRSSSWAIPLAAARATVAQHRRLAHPPGRWLGSRGRARSVTSGRGRLLAMMATRERSAECAKGLGTQAPGVYPVLDTSCASPEIRSCRLSLPRAGWGWQVRSQIP